MYLMLSVKALERLLKICKGKNNWTVARTFYIFLFVFLLMRGISFFIISGLENLHLGHVDEEMRHLWFQLLFMIPAYLFISVYILLFLAFMEIIIFSRVQLVITRSWFKKRWKYAFYIFNSFYWIAQAISYAGVFTSVNTRSGKWITKFIFQSLWVCNFVLPFIALVTYSYITTRFAGFPFTNSLSKERHERMSRLFLVWSFSRVLSGLSFVCLMNKAWSTDTRG